MTPPRDRRRGAALLSAIAAAAGVGLCAWALWTPAKALIGQHLIGAAFERAQAEGGAVKPWAWADVAPIARLRFPSLGGAERLVLDQASGEAMAWGPGWIRGTARLGAPGVSAVAAHRDTHFALLEGLAPGDAVVLETAGGLTARYRMLRGAVVDSRDWRLPVAADGPDLLVLSTCWPFGDLTPGPLRYVVFAMREPEPPAL